MLKGHTKIELTNVKTGERQVVEDDNLVTNALNMYFRQSPNIADIMKPISNPLVDTYFGGLLLFQNTIEEKADNYNLPLGNIMVGNATVNYSPSGEYPEFGNYNSEESAFSVNERTVTRKYVYDFGTSKANGSISAVCLTNLFAGFMGAGNKSLVKNKEASNGIPFDSNFFMSGYKAGIGIYINGNSSALFQYADDVAVPVYAPTSVFSIDMQNNCVYWVSSYACAYSTSYPDAHFLKTGKLPLYKSHFPFNKINPTVPLFSKGTIYEKIEVTVPSELTIAFSGKRPYVATFKSNGDTYFIIHTAATIAVASNFYLWRVSADGSENELFTLTNTTQIAMSVTAASSINIPDIPFSVCEGYLLYYSSNNLKVLKIKISDPTDTTEIVVDISKISTSTTKDLKGWIVLKNSAFLYLNSSEGIVLRIDVANNTALPLNGAIPFTDTRYPYAMLPFGDDSLIQRLSSDLSVTSDGCYRNPYTLSTINNLPEPVTKTSDMTMKITYTITSKIEPDEEG